jgi:hypothetical protein
MAKKHPRSGKPVPGGRVTPKGVRPDGTTSGNDDHESRAGSEPPRARPAKQDQGHGRQFVSQPGPTRAGHHRGQR